MSFQRATWRLNGRSGKTIYTSSNGPLVWLTTFDTTFAASCGKKLQILLWAPIQNFSRKLKFLVFNSLGNRSFLLWRSVRDPKEVVHSSHHVLVQIRWFLTSRRQRCQFRYRWSCERNHSDSEAEHPIRVVEVPQRLSHPLPKRSHRHCWPGVDKSRNYEWSYSCWPCCEQLCAPNARRCRCPEQRHSERCSCGIDDSIRLPYLFPLSSCIVPGQWDSSKCSESESESQRQFPIRDILSVSEYSGAKHHDHEAFQFWKFRWAEFFFGKMFWEDFKELSENNKKWMITEKKKFFSEFLTFQKKIFFQRKKFFSFFSSLKINFKKFVNSKKFGKKIEKLKKKIK